MADKILRQTEGGVALQKARGPIFDPKTLGDGEIIAMTVQTTSPNGLIQFSTTLPSGRRIESEWLREDQLKKALLPWIETIKAELQADADEVRAKARRESEERKARASVLVSPSGDALSAEPALSVLTPTMPKISMQGAESFTPVAQSSPSAANLADPLGFAKQGLVQAQADATYWQDQAQQAMGKWQVASDNVTKWENILAAIGPKDSVNADVSIADVPTGSGGGAVPSIRRGRPPGSKNRPKLAVSPAGEPYLPAGREGE